MQEIKRLQDASFTAGQDWSREFQGRVLNALGVKFSASLTADGTGVTTVFTDPIGQLFGVFELVQNETPLIRLPADVLYWLCSYVNGEPGHKNEPASISAAGSDVANFHAFLDFGAMVGPLAMVDARMDKIFTRSRFGAVTAYSANVASATGTVRQHVRTSDRLPRGGGEGIGYLRPQFWWIDVDLSGGGDNIEATIRFEQDLYLPFLLAVVSDASAGGTTANANPQAARVNGLVKQISCDVQSRETNGEVFRASWGEMIGQTWKRSGWGGSQSAASAVTMDRADPLTQKPDGVAAIPFIEEGNTRVNGAKLFKRGDAIIVRVATALTVEQEFTGVTAASGDKLRLAIPAFAPVQVGDDSDQPGIERAAPVARPAASLARRAASARGGLRR